MGRPKTIKDADGDNVTVVNDVIEEREPVPEVKREPAQGEWYGINYMGRRVLKKPVLTIDDPARGNRVV